MIVNGENRWANFGNSVKVKQVVYGYKKTLLYWLDFPRLLVLEDYYPKEH